VKRFKNILCVLTRAPRDREVVERAVTLAQSNQAQLTIVAVADRVSLGMGMPDGGPISSKLQAAIIDTYRQSLERLAEPYRARLTFETRVLVGMRFLEIIREVLRSGHDLLIQAAENPDWLDRLLGSEDMHLLRKCPCPVWLIKPAGPKSYHRILAAVDLDYAYPQAELEVRQALNRQILELASSLAQSESAELHVVHAWEAIGEIAMRGGLMRMRAEQIDEYVQEVRRLRQAGMQSLREEVRGDSENETRDYPDVIEHLVKGSPRKTIPALAQRIEADLVVMGTVARTGIPGLFMGNTAELILSQIDSSVLAVKPVGFETPITLEES
jgi:universal stress protein E